jgi:hypothetical protein
MRVIDFLVEYRDAVEEEKARNKKASKPQPHRGKHRR